MTSRAPVGSLSIYAGPGARAAIARDGLSPDMVEVVAGAAGGPKWLVLHGLDRAVFSSWIMERKRPLHLVGSSVGSWRFAALAQGMDAHERFLAAYLAQRYTENTAPSITVEVARMLDAVMDGGGPERILSSPFARLNVLAVRCRWPYTTEQRHALMLLIIKAFLLNGLGRSLLSLFFSRVLFYDPRDLPPFFSMEGFPLRRVALAPQNVRQAVMASGSIPLIMEGVRDIEGAGAGMYRDAGILDYHLAIPFHSAGIVLFPHYMGRIMPGWFDKMLPWRKPSLSDMDKVVLVCPSPAFMERLPGKAIPSRDDFKTFLHRDQERIDRWKRVVRESARLGDEFLEIVSTGSIVEHLLPLELLARRP